MRDKDKTKISKLMSLVLRHKPEALDLKLDASGWIKLSTLVQGLKTRYPEVTNTDVMDIVATCDKQRYAISADGVMIRANQGHSIEIDHDFKQSVPPPFLYHGTSQRNLEKIFETGLLKMKRHHVHLSSDEDTAMRVGRRHGGALVVLTVDTSAMIHHGFVFFESANGVWLTESVPPKYLHATYHGEPDI